MSITAKDWGLTSFTVIACLAVMAGLSYACGANSVAVVGYPAVWWCAVIAMGIQWLMWVPASWQKNEKYYDFTGGMTYIALVLLSLWFGSTAEMPSIREWLMSAMVGIWAFRLSTFLFRRVHRAGKDRRFDVLKQNPVRFLVPWTVQGLWVFLTMLAVITLNCQSVAAPSFGGVDAIGLFLWCGGFAIEVMADRQKTAFNKRPENRGKWIDEGLWSKAQHPNYFGEILLWFGMAVLGFSALQGTEYIALISPFFVAWLLLKISGVPMLRDTSMKKWGDNPEYLAYLERTRVLFPW